MSNVEFGSPSPKVSVETSYRGISKSHMVLQKSAMKELRTHLSFTQLRFHCHKKQGRTFHVVTASNSSGEAVVRYFILNVKLKDSVSPSLSRSVEWCCFVSCGFQFVFAH